MNNSIDSFRSINSLHQWLSEEPVNACSDQISRIVYPAAVNLNSNIILQRIW